MLTERAIKAPHLMNCSRLSDTVLWHKPISFPRACSERASYLPRVFPCIYLYANSLALRHRAFAFRVFIFFPSSSLQCRPNFVRPRLQDNPESLTTARVGRLSLPRSVYRWKYYFLEGYSFCFNAPKDYVFFRLAFFT